MRRTQTGHMLRQLQSGQPADKPPEQVAVMDLRLLVAQMQADQSAWNPVTFLCSRAAAELVEEAKAMRPTA